MASRTTIKTVLSIAGSDPSSGAGLQRDILTFKDMGVRPLSAVSAITVQDSKKVFKVEAVKSSLLRNQVSALADEFKVDALKIGMLATKENVQVVRWLIEKYNFKVVVLDTIIKSSSGKYLLKRDAIKALKELIAATTAVTPNTDEAEVLSGVRITNIAAMESAAKIIYSLGTAHVIVTGGHLRGTVVTDVLYDGHKFTHFKGSRIRATKSKLHGTGCAFSSALTAAIATGSKIEDAIRIAKDYVVKSL